GKMATDTSNPAPVKGTLKDGTVKWYTSRKKRYFKCGKQERYPHLFNCRYPVRVRAEKVEVEVWRKVVEFLHDPTVLSAYLEPYIDEADDLLSVTQEDLELAVEKLQELEMQKQRLFTAFTLNVGMTEADLTMRVAHLDEQIEFWKERKARAERDRPDQEAGGIIIAAFMQVSAWAGDIPSTGEVPGERKREVIRRLVKRVEVSADDEVAVVLGVPSVGTNYAQARSC
ncbi:MAG: hypothetical protein M3P51_10350, partial [Chloroflexota bacterium]|nr:hypothetical protein [Chloroflexota bacterium]